MTLDAGSKLGQYEILEPIGKGGKGGMGEVYRARDDIGWSAGPDFCSCSMYMIVSATMRPTSSIAVSSARLPSG